MRLLPLLVLAACSSQAEQSGGLTTDDRRELNEAAEMLDADSMEVETITTNESPAP